MIERYRNGRIAEIWSDRNKLNLWLTVELAIVLALEEFRLIPKSVHGKMARIFGAHPIDAKFIRWWKARDKKIHHDLNAFLDALVRFLPKPLQAFLHKRATSYDTEEAALAMMIRDSLMEVGVRVGRLESILVDLARRYRYTLMMGRTHGQGGDLVTFGGTCLTYIAQIRSANECLNFAAGRVKMSRISGPMGHYSGLDPKVEARVLAKLGLLPFYGATQILPRQVMTPLADSLADLVLTLEKIAEDIRLGARSPKPTMQEPFGRLQKGSSAMPNKRNPIRCEQMEGMGELAVALATAIKHNIPTWERRAIGQSCVERVAWPDMFHVVVHCLDVMTKVLSGLQVYPDNMLWEISESRGCYAASEVVDFLKEIGPAHGLGAEECYRIVQLAAANTTEVSPEAKNLRGNPPKSFDEAIKALHAFNPPRLLGQIHLWSILARGKLRAVSDLAASSREVKRWNRILVSMFTKQETVDGLARCFNPKHILRNEPFLYEKIIGE